MKAAKIFFVLLSSFCLLALEVNSAAIDNGPGVGITRQAVELGISPSVLSHMWSSKKPVEITKRDEAGGTSTATYQISPGLDRIIVIESAPPKEQAPKQQAQPEPELEPEPQLQQQPEAQVTSTTPPTELQPKQVSTTTTAPTPVAASNPESDWEYVSGPNNRRTFTLPDFNTGFEANWPDFGTPFQEPGRTVTHTIRTFGPVTTGTNSWPLLWPKFDLPSGVTPQTTTKTETDDQGRTIITRTRTYSGPAVTVGSTGGLPASWQPSAQPSFPVSWPFANPFLTNSGDQPNVTPTLTPTLTSSAAPTWTSSNVPSLTPATASNPLPMPTPLPLPSRPVSFLPQYPPLPTAATTPQPLSGFDQPTEAKPVFNVNLDDLPTFRSFSTGTTQGQDFDPKVKEMLSRGGITDADIEEAKTHGKEVIRTRVLPDGRTIKTTFRVNHQSGPAAVPVQPAIVPLAPVLPASSAPPARPLPSPSYGSYAPPAYPMLPTPPARDNTIENYLSKVHLTPDDIRAQNGEVVKTIVDENGRVLSVKYVLSDVRGEGKDQGQARELPNK